LKNYLSAQNFFNLTAFSCGFILIYFKKDFSVLWPVIFIMDKGGNPDKKRLVAKLLLAVWVVINSNFFDGCYARG
jgi:hypothetical protein